VDDSPVDDSPLDSPLSPVDDLPLDSPLATAGCRCFYVVVCYHL